MHFKHPEYLYALIALIIPILVHLFQLRRFQKVAFTNVEFLKKVTLQTRKSSQIKKWLTLLARLMALAALIIAFAQPFAANQEIVGKQSETAIYLDNSFSMQARGAKGPLLQRAVQELLSNLPDDEMFSLFTNTETFKDVTKKDIQNDVLQLEHSSSQMDYAAAYLKGKQLLGRIPESLKRVIMISDFQQKEEAFSIPSDSDTSTSLVQLQPVTNQNISIDSLFLQRNTNNELMLNLIVSTIDINAENIPVALYNDEKLMAKTSISIPKNGQITTQFRIDDAIKINGKVSIEDPALSFDNSRYFTINIPEKIKVVAINESDDNFIKNIYTPDKFTVISTTITALDYNDISTANLVIINELKQLPIPLVNALKSLADQGGTICFIPSEEGNISSYQQLLSRFSPEVLFPKRTQEKKITTIHFSHPVFRGVFDKKISNFQYPKVNSYFPSNTTGNSILSYEDGSPFLFKTIGMYVFTAAINTKNSNFKNSPLIVPALYNIGKQSLQSSDISYIIGQTNTYDVPIVLGQDGILSLASDQERIIPLQQSFANKVRITTDDSPDKAGIYTLKNDQKSIQNVSYNYDSQESSLQYYHLTTTDTYQVHDSVVSLFEQLREETSVNEFWKWFVIFALLFLFIEILLLKYLK